MADQSQQGDRLERWVIRRSVWARHGISFLCGGLATLALPPIYIVPLLLVAFPVLLLLLRAAPTRRHAAALGWWFGAGHFISGFYWISIAFMVNDDVSDAAGPVAAVGVALVMAVYPALAALFYVLWRRWRPKAPVTADVLMFALLWSVMEVLRGWLFTGFPWNPIGSVWAFSPAMMQSSAVWSVWGLGLITVAIAVLPVTVLSGDNGWRRYGSVAIGAFVLVVLWGGGALRLNMASSSHVPDVQLRLVQANVNQNEKWRDDRLSDNFTRHLAMSIVPATKPVTHIIWPETAIPYFINRDSDRRAMVADVVPTGGYVITGAPRLERGPGDAPIIGNSLFAIDDIGAMAGAYDKVHLVPFGEYLPFRSFLMALGFERFVPGILGVDFTPGPDLKTLSLAGLPPFSPLICYEIIFPGAVVKHGDAVSWILNITNDGWYGQSTGPYQHLVAAQFRAVEEGLPVIRVAGTGISAVIDSYGRIESSLILGKRGIIDSGLPRMIEHRTVFARYGYWCYFSLLGILAALVNWCAVTRTGGKRVMLPK